MQIAIAVRSEASDSGSIPRMTLTDIHDIGHYWVIPWEGRTASEYIRNNEQGDCAPLVAPYHVASVNLLKELVDLRPRLQKPRTMIKSAIALAAGHGYHRFLLRRELTFPANI
jgi:hypothetical protein